MTKDILVRLRSVAPWHRHLWWAKYMLEAADEIEMLRGELFKRCPECEFPHRCSPEAGCGVVQMGHWLTREDGSDD